MIDSTGYISDAQIVAAWDHKALSLEGVPHILFIDTIRPVLDMALAAYVEDRQSAATEMVASLERMLAGQKDAV